MMKLKHNKRRNTAFIYEALIREMTKSIIARQPEKKEQINSLLKEFFHPDRELYKELEIYKSILNTQHTKPHIAEKIILESRRVYSTLNRSEIYKEQSALISRINKNLSKNVFSNFVPNYKSLATIAQLFSDNTPVKTRVLLEENLIKRMSDSKSNDASQMSTVDNLTYRTFAKKFNKEYRDRLHEEQKRLINKYVSSFQDNGVELKLFLNEEIGRAKDILKRSLQLEDIKNDPTMVEKTEKILFILEDYKNNKIDKSMLQEFLKIQSLLREIQE